MSEKSADDNGMRRLYATALELGPLVLFFVANGRWGIYWGTGVFIVATAIALTGSSLNIVPIQLYAQIRGDVLGNPHLGYAMAFGMIVVTAVANVIYIWLRIRAERWLK